MKIVAAEDTFFKVKKTLNCRGKLLDLSTPAIMGIMNITPDSFHAGSRFTDENSALLHVEKMILDGADIIDIGGQSTRPGAVQISADEEWERIGKFIKLILNKFPGTIVSVDTFYSSVAEKALDAGVSIINDISAGEFDQRMPDLVAERQVPYIIMHMQGTPATMQQNPQYKNVVKDVLDFFAGKLNFLKSKNIHDIIVDPGFGFGKTSSHNYSLLKNLPLFRMFECPVLAGLSRKSMITKVLNVLPEEAKNGTTTLNTLAILNGASILRVHDVKEAVETRKLTGTFLQQNEETNKLNDFIT